MTLTLFYLSPDHLFMLYFFSLSLSLSHSRAAPGLPTVTGCHWEPNEPQQTTLLQPQPPDDRERTVMQHQCSNDTLARRAASRGHTTLGKLTRCCHSDELFCLPLKQYYRKYYHIVIDSQNHEVIKVIFSS